jgi:hypothetical protein
MQAFGVQRVRSTGGKLAVDACFVWGPAIAFLVASGFAEAAPADSGAASSASAPAVGHEAPYRLSSAERSVMERPEVKSWTAAARKAGRVVTWRQDAVSAEPRCTDITLYEDAGPYLTRFGTWRACGPDVRRLRDD